MIPTAPRDAALRLLLVEDDPGDRVLFEEALDAADPDLEIVVLDGLEGVGAALAERDISCLVLDLGLPGLSGLEALDRIVALAPELPVVVLTGWGNSQAGVDAVVRGAQDYLVKGAADGSTIARSVRFAVERKRNQVANAALAEAQLRQVEQQRLERALLANPSIRRADLHWSSRYIAARPGAVSGDFFDGVELSDGGVRIVLGDVAGHGADEAALGVSLRAGWRALVLAGLDADDTLAALERLLVDERPRGDEFATVCDLTIPASLDGVCVRSAGHPPPILAGRGPLVDENMRAPLGVAIGSRLTHGTSHSLGESWSLAMFTDGLFEVRDDGGRILTVDDVPAVVEASVRDGCVDPQTLVDSFASRAVGGWRDDVAVVVLTRPDPAPRAFGGS